MYIPERTERLQIDLIFDEAALNSLTFLQKEIISTLLIEAGQSDKILKKEDYTDTQIELNYDFNIDYINTAYKFDTILALTENPNVKFSRAKLDTTKCLFVNLLDSIRKIEKRLEESNNASSN